MKKNFLEEAQELYGEQRNFTPEEREIYNRVTKEQSVPVGENIFDLLRKKKFPKGFFEEPRPEATEESDDEIYVRLSKEHITFVDEEAEKIWDDFVEGKFD